MLDLDTLFVIVYLGIWIYGFAVLIYYSLNKKKFPKRKNIDNDCCRTSSNYNHTNNKSNSNNEPDLINPTTGALMIGGFSGVDTFGNSFGSDVGGGIYND
ncbi:MAG: hypothetical protein WCS26_07535 [Arcobacteraceae bacterium]